MSSHGLSCRNYPNYDHQNSAPEAGLSVGSLLAVKAASCLAFWAEPLHVFRVFPQRGRNHIQCLSDASSQQSVTDFPGETLQVAGTCGRI